MAVRLSPYRRIVAVGWGDGGGEPPSEEPSEEPGSEPGSEEPSELFPHFDFDVFVAIDISATSWEATCPFGADSGSIGGIFFIGSGNTADLPAAFAASVSGGSAIWQIEGGDGATSEGPVATLTYNRHTGELIFS